MRVTPLDYIIKLLKYKCSFFYFNMYGFIYNLPKYIYYRESHGANTRVMLLNTQTVIKDLENRNIVLKKI